MVSVGWKKINSSSTSDITFLNLKKHSGIIFKNGSDAVVLSDLRPADRNYKYAIQPGLDSTKATHVKTYLFSDDFSLPFIRKKGNLVQFQNKKLILLDSSIREADKKIKVDYVFVHQNSQLKAFANLNYGLLIVNADNSNRYTDSLVKYLAVCNKKYYVLKRNKALNLSSN